MSNIITPPPICKNVDMVQLGEKKLETTPVLKHTVPVFRVNHKEVTNDEWGMGIRWCSGTDGVGHKVSLDHFFPHQQYGVLKGLYPEKCIKHYQLSPNRIIGLES